MDKNIKTKQKRTNENLDEGARPVLLLL